MSRSEKFDDSKIGANASAEEANEGTDDSSVSGIDVVLDNRLQKTGFGTKKEFMVYFKDFIKKYVLINFSSCFVVSFRLWRCLGL